MTFRYDATDSGAGAKLVKVYSQNLAAGIQGKIHIHRAAVARHMVDVEVALLRMADAFERRRLQRTHIGQRLGGLGNDVIAELAVDVVAVERAIDLPLL